MFGVAAFAAALAAAIGQHPALALSPATGVRLPRVPLIRIAPLPQAHRTRTCSATRSRPSGVERKVLPVACEQPPRSNVTLPNATGGLGSILGTGR